MTRYNPSEIEPKWQKKWEENGTYAINFESDKPKYVGFGMFNYPSGAGIHIGHVRNYTIPDVVTRAKRQQGFESYQPVGWDSFGLPAENFAIKTGISPRESTKKAISKYHDQYRAMGWAVDWQKEINTTDPAYYKWTQWAFLKLFEHGLAYQQERAQWWCDQCKTVLADEQVIGGKCWRHEGANNPFVTKRNLKQWFFKITEYADEMLDATGDLSWTPSVKASQKAWIGKSVGAEILFSIPESALKIPVFTTRPDTLYGATFIVLAPEHELVKQVTTEQQRREVESYARATVSKSEVQRQQDADKQKTGVFTGAYATNPANGKKIPIWVADYVLTGYGTGTIMGVPGHDARDFAFAKKFNLPVRFVVEPTFGEPAGGDTHKKSVFVVVRNPSTGKVIILDWGLRKDRHGGKMLIGGGVEGSEDYAAAAAREITEETGYKNFTFVKETEFLGHGYFYSNTKHKNMHVSGKGLLFDLVDEERIETSLDEGEKDKFTVTWEPVEKAASLLDDGVHEAFYRYLALGECYTGEGIMADSGEYDGMASSDTREKIVADLLKKSAAHEKVNYKLRDWLVSRQRYWGAPIPIIHCKKDGAVAVPENDLPVALPDIEQYLPTGNNVSVLAGVDEWVNTVCPKCGGFGKRETDTLDGYVCSSWYFLRYLDPANDSEAWNPGRVKEWMPVDFYNGADHATAHLLYARFFTRFFHKLGLVAASEPFKTMVFNGKIKDSDGSAFSKSKGNGIDPLEIIEQGYGADAVRLYEMFAAPVEQDVLWDPQGIPGTYRFLNRLWVLTQEFLEAELDADPGSTSGQATATIAETTHKTIKKVTEDIEAYRFNTAIAAMMEAVNGLYKIKAEHGMRNRESWQAGLENIVQLLAPFAPHISEELWSQLGHTDSIHIGHWPDWDEALLVQDTVTMAIQVNGKVRAELQLGHSADEEAAKAAALANDNVKHFVGEKAPRRIIYVPGKILNIVV